MLLGLVSSYSWYDVAVRAVSQDGPGGRKYSSYSYRVVLTAEDSKANSDLLLLLLILMF